MTDLIAWLLSVLLGLSVSGSATAEPAPATPLPTAAAEHVVLEVGHCWIEPVAVGGREWNVPRDRQLGWGGRLPRRWQGEGTFTIRSPRRATYVDDGSGTRLPMRPADAPGVTLEGQLCR